MSTDKDNVRYLSNRSLAVHEESEIAKFEEQLKRDSWKQAIQAVSFLVGAILFFSIAFYLCISLQGALAKGLTWLAF